MDFRPCIDIHNGAVKQIVGGSLTDNNNAALENFVSDQNGAFFAEYYKSHGLKGGHIILLNPASSEYYAATKNQALSALKAYPQGLQIGGGITAENAGEFLSAGASHVIVTSYVFKNGVADMDRLKQLSETAGRKHLVIDLSCRKRGNEYYIVTDRWQKFTDVVVNHDTLSRFAMYCDEFLVHAVDVEGKCSGIETTLAAMLGDFAKETGMTITYAGGVGSFEDLKQLATLGHGCLNVTIGSALDIFGGSMPFDKVLSYCKNIPAENISSDREANA